MYLLNNVPTQQFTLLTCCETFSSHLTETLAFLDFVNLIPLIYFPRKSASERIELSAKLTLTQIPWYVW